MATTDQLTPSPPTSPTTSNESISPDHHKLLSENFQLFNEHFMASGPPTFDNPRQHLEAAFGTVWVQTLVDGWIKDGLAKRPMNTWMLYSKNGRAALGYGINENVKSKILSAKWLSLRGTAEKEYWDSLGAAMKAFHAESFSGYKYQPGARQRLEGEKKKQKQKLRGLQDGAPIVRKAKQGNGKAKGKGKAKGNQAATSPNRDDVPATSPLPEQPHIMASSPTNTLLHARDPLISINPDLLNLDVQHPPFIAVAPGLLQGSFNGTIENMASFNATHVVGNFGINPNSFTTPLNTPWTRGLELASFAGQCDSPGSSSGSLASQDFNCGLDDGTNNERGRIAYPDASNSGYTANNAQYMATTSYQSAMIPHPQLNPENPNLIWSSSPTGSISPALQGGVIAPAHDDDHFNASLSIQNVAGPSSMTTDTDDTFCNALRGYHFDLTHPAVDMSTLQYFGLGQEPVGDLDIQDGTCVAGPLVTPHDNAAQKYAGDHFYSPCPWHEESLSFDDE